VNKAPYSFNEHIFRCIAFPGIAGESDDPKINIVECDLECPGRFVPKLADRVNLAYIMLAVKFKGYGKGYGIHSR
jgi:hypothetical protein